MKLQVNSRSDERFVAKAAGILALAILAYMSAVGSSAPAWAQSMWPGCLWFGTPPLCDGQCPAGYVYTGHRKACFPSGSQRYCCPSSQRPETKGVTNCRWAGSPANNNLVYVCEEAFLKFYIRNSCNTTVAVQVQFMSVNGGWQMNNYRFAPGEVGYLVDTKNRFIHVTARSLDGRHNWPRHQVNMGGKLDRKYTHTLNCR